MNDPPRLLTAPDQLTPAERRALRAGRAETLDPSLRAAVWTGVVAELGSMSQAAAAAVVAKEGAAAACGKLAGGAPAAASTGLAVGAHMGRSWSWAALSAKWMAGGLVAGSLFAATVHGTVRRIQNPETPPPRVTAGSPSRVVSTRIGPGTGPGAPARSEQHAERSGTPAARAADRQETVPRGPAAPRVTSARHGEIAIPPPLPSPAREEAARVTIAREQLRQGHPGAALTTLRQLDRDLTEGALTQEREALRAEALFASGQLTEARQAAHAFVDRYPESPQAPRLRSLTTK